MQISLQTPARKTFALAVCVFMATAFAALAATELLAGYFADRADLASLQRAVRLEPGNADYRFRLGHYLTLVQTSPATALESYKTAVALDPHRSRYWLGLAAAYETAGDTEAQQEALERAIAADPKTPDVAWEAANLYLVRGQTEKALGEFRVVLENDPSLTPAALRLCWRISPSVESLLAGVIPPSSEVYFAFLDLLTANRETIAAARVWMQLAQLRQPLEQRRTLEYLRYLIGHREVDQARLVWQQAADISGLAAYQPSPTNLVINGDFSLDVLNGGFDWTYEKLPSVSLALDPTQSHSGHRSLSIAFDGPGIEDTGIRQLIPVEPNTAYDFSAYFKSENIQGAGGPRFAIQDAYSENLYLASEDLKGVDFWKQVNGTFLTGPETKLVALRIQRVPLGSPIKGRLWIDGVRLSRKD